MVVKRRGPASVVALPPRARRVSPVHPSSYGRFRRRSSNRPRADHSVTGLLNDQNVVNAEDEAERIKQEMDPELWDALHWDEDAEAEKRGMELDEAGRRLRACRRRLGGQAARGTELIGIPERRKKGKKAPVATRRRPRRLAA